MLMEMCTKEIGSITKPKEKEFTLIIKDLDTMEIGRMIYKKV